MHSCTHYALSSSNFTYLKKLFFIFSTCEAWILELWGKDCGPYMQALQFFRGLGYIVGPILADPFLSLEVNDEDMDSETLNSTETNWTTSTTASNLTLDTTPISKPYNNRIQTPYLINSALLLFGAFLLLSLFAYQKFKVTLVTKFDLTKGQSEQTIVSSLSTISISTLARNRSISIPSNNEISDSAISQTRSSSTVMEQPSGPLPEEHSCFTLVMIILSSVFYLFFYEEVIVTYLPSYCTQISLKLTKSEASLLTSVFNFANLIGKAISILLGK